MGKWVWLWVESTVGAVVVIHWLVERDGMSEIWKRWDSLRFEGKCMGWLEMWKTGWLALGREGVVSLSTGAVGFEEYWRLWVVDCEEEQEEFFARVEVRDFTANCSSKKSERNYLCNNLCHANNRLSYFWYCSNVYKASSIRCKEIKTVPIQEFLW